jgi:hypothetical protein
MPNTMDAYARPQTRRHIAPKDPGCPTCRRTSRRRLETPLLEALQQLTRCRRCGAYHGAHRVQHPHLLVTPGGEVECDGWCDGEEETPHE